MAPKFNFRILRVDLTYGRLKSEELDERTVRRFIGGSGIGSKIIWEETDKTTNPLSPENPLIFMTGPFTGTSVPMNSRMTVSSLSPLTGIWGEAHCGGSWPDELKRTGFDGLLIHGKAQDPVYLSVHDGEAELVSANHLWGKNTRETDDLLKKETDPKAIPIIIGQAGERLVKVACLISGGRREERGASRCGLGAVMGSKNLKAIVVRGTKTPQVFDPVGLKESIERHWRSKITLYEPRRRSEIYGHHLKENFAGGKEGIKNFREVRFEGSADKFAAEVQRGGPLFCRHCITSCLESNKDGDVRRTMGGAITMLGADCFIDDVEAIRAAYHLCNEFGIDIKSTGPIIAFTMECFEKGLLSKSDLEGIDLAWGNGAGMVAMVKKIGLREGFGAVLGEGVKRAAEMIGGNACEYAMHIKGLEIPNWDPRSSNFRALGEATGNIGADPYNASGPNVRHSAIPELGIYERDGDAGESRFIVEGKGQAVANGQNFGVLVNSLGICRQAFSNWMPKDQHLPPSACVEWLNCITGWDMNLTEFLQCGERIFNLQRMINVRRGMSRKDDTLPARMLTEKPPDGPNQGHVPPLGEMLGDYYSYREWSKEGIPTRKKLAELGLEGLTQPIEVRSL